MHSFRLPCGYPTCPDADTDADNAFELCGPRRMVSPAAPRPFGTGIGLDSPQTEYFSAITRLNEIRKQIRVHTSQRARSNGLFTVVV